MADDKNLSDPAAAKASASASDDALSVSSSATPLQTAAAAPPSLEGAHILLHPPSSVEEAGALLGASILRASPSSSSSSTNNGANSLVMPPPGVHSSFATIAPVPSSELFVRLSSLRSLLRDASAAADRNDDDDDGEGGRKKKRKKNPLPAAPGVLAVLMKVLGASSAIAAAPPPDSLSGSNHAPPRGLSPPPPSSSPGAAEASSSSLPPDETTISTGGFGGGGPTASTVSSSSSIRSATSAAPLPSAHTPRPVRATPPMLSNPLRKLWVDCVVLCHRLSDGLAGRSRGADASVFLRKMTELAGMNPRSGRAAGGTRLAALDVIGGLFSDDITATLVAPWAHEVLHLCHRGLKSSGAGAPSFRVSSVRTASAVAVGCRNVALRQHRESANAGSERAKNKIGTFSIRGSLEDRAIAESVRLAKRASDDRYPEVRGAAASFVAAVSPALILSVPPPGAGGGPSGGGGGGGGGRPGGPGGGGGGPPSDPAVPTSPTACLDDVMGIAMKNLDDESAGVAAGWAEALARCVCVSVEYGEQTKAANPSSTRRAEESEEGGGGGAPSSSSDAPNDLVTKLKTFSESRRAVGMSVSCSSLPAALEYLVNQFAKVGGELSASRMGGSHSVGGRSTRSGLSLVIVNVLRLMSADGSIGVQSGRISATDAIRSVLDMVGPKLEKQLRPKKKKGSVVGSVGGSARSAASDAAFQLAESLDGTAAASLAKSTSSAVFGGMVGGRNRSLADAGLARLATNRALRRGLSEASNEPTQVSILRDLTDLCGASAGADAGGGGGGAVDSSSSGGGAAGGSTTTSAEGGGALNGNQLQVSLVEISHLVSALGDAAASALPDLVPALRGCLGHRDPGVRIEAAAAAAAIASAFPTEGRKFLVAALEELRGGVDGLLELADAAGDEAAAAAAAVAPTARRRRFRRNVAAPSKSAAATAEKAARRQHAIHGSAVAVSLLLRDLPALPGGLPTEIFDEVMGVAECLVSCQYKVMLAKVNPGGACVCVRAGYCITSGALAMGADAISSKIATIFGLWQRAGRSAEEGTNGFAPDHDLICVDAALLSIVVFLKSCPDLLLAVPEALNRTTLLLEKVFPLLSPGGRLGGKPLNAAALSRQESAKASILEAFSWLPPGSFPLAADQIFTFAASLIQSGTVDDVCCSLVPRLVAKEDKILDAQTMSRASAVGQVGGARDVEENLVALTCEAAPPAEREAVLYFLASRRSDDPARGPFPPPARSSSHGVPSPILDLCANGGSSSSSSGDLPTPLHEVGTWKEPAPPSSTSKVRLVDSAIHAFAATFGLKDGKEQQSAMRMLEALLVPALMQSARGFGVGQSLIDTASDRRTRTKQEIAAVSNTAATLLACLQALPLHEATHDTPIGMGPPWMNTAKHLFFTLLPSSSHLVRRAAAEGLALLATLGVTEDAHTLQSSILHSLDEVMQGNLPDANPRRLQAEALSSARAGSLLTLACIQRTAQNIASKGDARSRARSSRPRNSDETNLSAPPTMIMMTRVLPSLATHSPESDSFLVRTYALHTFGLLISYSAPFQPLSPAAVTDEDLHILRKAVEVVEDSFLATWTAVSSEYDKGREAEKFSSEAAFISVLLRLMTFLLPRLELLKATDPTIASRFSGMATIIMESSACHPMVIFEGLAFFERLANHQQSSCEQELSITSTGCAVASVMPFILAVIKPDRPRLLPAVGGLEHLSCLESFVCQRAAVMCLRMFSYIPDQLSADALKNSVLHAHLFTLLEMRCGSRHFQRASTYRTVTASRDAESSAGECDVLETEIVLTIESILLLEGSRVGVEDTRRLLHLILFARAVLSGGGEMNDSQEEDDDVSSNFTLAKVRRHAVISAGQEASLVLDHASPSRWQVKCEATRFAALSLSELLKVLRAGSETFELDQSPHLNPVHAKALCAKTCRLSNEASTPQDYPASYLIFHLDDIISAACSTAAATSDQAELPSLQNGGLRLLIMLVKCFGDVPDPELVSSTDLREGQCTSVLEQFSSQVFSSIKHALSCASNADCEDVSQVLFMSGCEALEVVLKKKVLTEYPVFKRLVRPIMPSSSELPFFFYPENQNCELAARMKPPSMVSDTRSLLLNRIGKLWALAKLRLLVEANVAPRPVFAPFLEEVYQIEGEIAAHSAALAIDGCRILRGEGLTLCGEVLSDTNEPTNHQISCSPGLSYANFENIDEEAKAGLVQTWPVLASSATNTFVKMIEQHDAKEGKVAPAKVWVLKLTPFLFVGLEDALQRIDGGLDVNSNSSSSWMSPEASAISCLQGIRTVVRGWETVGIASLSDIEILIQTMSRVILFPFLGLPESFSDMTSDEILKMEKGSTRAPPTELSNELAAECCGLFEDLCNSRSKSNANLGGDALLRAVLLPIVALQGGKISADKDSHRVSEVVASSIHSIQTLIAHSAGADCKELALAMLQFSLSVLSSNVISAKVKEASSLLFKVCVEKSNITVSEKQAIALETAKAGNWVAWGIVCSTLEDGSGITSSILPIKDALGDLRDSRRHLAALSAIKKIVQESQQNQSMIIGSIMHGAGAEVVQILKAYGVLSLQDGVGNNRIVACADSMKLFMVAFQHLVSTQAKPSYEEAYIAAFLAILFEALVRLIEFNGLPNHPSQNLSGDPALGRMSAQAIVHIARSAPAAFKASMVNISAEDRRILETAVRADMSGYASPKSVPVKKTLNIKRFSTAQN